MQNIEVRFVMTCEQNRQHIVSLQNRNCSMDKVKEFKLPKCIVWTIILLLQHIFVTFFWMEEKARAWQIWGKLFGKQGANDLPVIWGSCWITALHFVTGSITFVHLVTGAGVGAKDWYGGLTITHGLICLRHWTTADVLGLRIW